MTYLWLRMTFSSPDLTMASLKMRRLVQVVGGRYDLGPTIRNALKWYSCTICNTVEQGDPVVRMRELCER